MNIKITPGPGTFQRPIVQWISDVINEQGLVTQPGYQFRPLNEDGSPQTENINIGNDNVLWEDDNGNKYLIPTREGYAQENEGLVLYQGNNILRKYRYPFECNIAHTSLTDLVEKINGFFDNNYPPVEQVTPARTSLLNDMKKGEKVIMSYLEDNREINLTKEQALQQLSKFGALEVLLRCGALGDARDILQTAVVDEIFTQARKDKYLGML